MSESQADIADLPGADLVLRGVEDLARGRPTAEAALVEVASTRLRALGLDLHADAPRADGAELSLYERLAAHYPDRDPYVLYGAWLDQLVSFLAALTQRREQSARAARATRVAP